MKLLRTLLHTLIDHVLAPDVSFAHPPRMLHLGDQEGRYSLKVITISVSDEAVKLRVSGWHADGVPREGDRLYVDADDNVCGGSVTGVFEFVDVEETPSGRGDIVENKLYRGVARRGKAL